MQQLQANLPDLKQLKAAIPRRCFEASLRTSLLYLCRDILYAAFLVFLALKIDMIPSAIVRIIAWTCYMFVQGCVGTGLWILGHECGHGAFSNWTMLNDTLGWMIHSVLFVPYFSWKITHARHHRYTGHLTKDAVFTPKVRASETVNTWSRVNEIAEMAEDTPIVTLLRLVAHQLVGWQLYLLFNITAGKDSLPAGRSVLPKTDASHFNPTSRLFLSSQRFQVLMSDLGLLGTLGILQFIAQHIGYRKVLLLYLGPYIWVHHWLVAITYLHHTHPEVPYHSERAWTFTQGALGTIDRNFGFIGRHFFHEIIDFHLVHHLFPKIPFYHAEEATKAIIPLLGSNYIEAKQDGFLQSLYKTFKSCNFVMEAVDGQMLAGGRDGKFYWVVKRG